MSILILGAGPAGSSCAIQLLKSGYEVILIDRAEFPRDMPGETLHPGVEPLLKSLDVFEEVQEFDFLRHSGISNIRSGVDHFEPYHKTEDWKGFQFFRKDFDVILLNKAIELGARFYGGESPLGITMRGQTIVSVELKKQSIQADYFIDATGKRTWLAKQAGIPITRYSKQRIAYYGYVEATQATKKEPRLIWDASGWTWISQVTNSKLAWVRLDLDQHKKLDKDWLPKQLKDYQPIGSKKAVDVTWRKADVSCRNNLFMAGDSAFVLDPGSSHGVLKAIMSGMMVAHLIEKGQYYDWEIIENHYNQWIDTQFQQDISKLREAYKIYDKGKSTRPLNVLKTK